MNKYGLFGKMQAKPGTGEELGKILLGAAGLMENAQGCLQYLVCKQAGDLDSIWIMEVWENKEDHDDSLKFPGVQELIMRAMPFLKEKPTGGLMLEVLGGKGLTRSTQSKIQS